MHEGAYAGGLKHGEGSQRYPDGSVYTATWARGVARCGAGRRRRAAGPHAPRGVPAASVTDAHGEISELKVMPEKRCAIVTYTLRKSAEEAAVAEDPEAEGAPAAAETAAHLWHFSAPGWAAGASPPQAAAIPAAC